MPFHFFQVLTPYGGKQIWLKSLKVSVRHLKSKHHKYWYSYSMLIPVFSCWTYVCISFDHCRLIRYIATVVDKITFNDLPLITTPKTLFLPLILTSLARHCKSRKHTCICLNSCCLSMSVHPKSAQSFFQISCFGMHPEFDCTRVDWIHPFNSSLEI